MVHLAGGNELAIGAEFEREHGTNRTRYSIIGSQVPADFDLMRSTSSAYSELKWLATRDLIVRAGVRFDSVTDNGSHHSPTLGVRYNLPSNGGGFKANYSEGFKPASFFALGLPVALGGNPDLRAERSKGMSFGYENSYWDGSGTGSVGLFRTRYADLVTFDNQTNRLVNANRVEIKGVEIEGGLQVTLALKVHLQFTRLFTHVIDSDEPLRQRPGRRGGMQVNWSPAATSTVIWRIEYAAATFDSSVVTGNVTLPTYLRSDIAYTQALRAGISAVVAVDNLFNKRNESYIGQTAPGRRVRAAVSGSF